MDVVLTLVVDGYNAPITAGNFVDLVAKKFYDNMEIQRSDGFVVQTGDPEGPAEGYVDPATGEVRRWATAAPTSKTYFSTYGISSLIIFKLCDARIEFCRQLRVTGRGAAAAGVGLLAPEAWPSSLRFCRASGLPGAALWWASHPARPAAPLAQVCLAGSAMMRVIRSSAKHHWCHQHVGLCLSIIVYPGPPLQRSSLPQALACSFFVKSPLHAGDGYGVLGQHCPPSAQQFIQLPPGICHLKRYMCGMEALCHMLLAVWHTSWSPEHWRYWGRDMANTCSDVVS
jgi:hypothetical protein